MRRNQRGFTLMELMVVIVIVAILAAVAVPLYINYVNDAKRSEAKGAIAAIISAEGIEYQGTNPNTYVGEGTGAHQINLTDPNGIVGEASRNWTFHITSSSLTGFTVTAVGKPGTPAATLEVECKYDRATGATWADKVSAPQ